MFRKAFPPSEKGFSRYFLFFFLFLEQSLSSIHVDVIGYPFDATSSGVPFRRYRLIIRRSTGSRCCCWFSLSARPRSWRSVDVGESETEIRIAPEISKALGDTALDLARSLDRLEMERRPVLPRRSDENIYTGKKGFCCCRKSVTRDYRRTGHSVYQIFISTTKSLPPPIDSNFACTCTDASRCRRTNQSTRTHHPESLSRFIPRDCSSCRIRPASRILIHSYLLFAFESVFPFAGPLARTRRECSPMRTTICKSGLKSFRSIRLTSLTLRW